MKNKSGYSFLTCIIMLLVGLLAGSYIERKNHGSHFFGNNASNKIEEVMGYINNDYVDTIDSEKIEAAAVSAMLEELDPHSQYVPKEEFDAVNDPLLGNFEGIGVAFRIEKDTVAIINTIKGGPSERTGIQDGDRIVYVEDSLIAGVGIKNDDVMRLLKGPKGTKVKVKVARRNTDQLFEYTIKRDVIPTYSIVASYMLSDDIGFIKLDKFSATTYDEFVDAVKKLSNAGMKKLVLDLRDNSGGYLGAAVDLAGEFLPGGSLIVYTEGRNRPRQTIKARRYTSLHGKLVDVPVAVLINDGSASASEIVAGALQDNDRSITIGRRSFGKGLVQEQIMLRDNSAIRLTVARYYTPLGRSIQKPFTEDHEKYYFESYERYDNGELFSADSIHFNDSLKYITPKGKVLYGGGGIMPDIYVPLVNDSTQYYFNKIVNSGLMHQYAFDYSDSHRQQLLKYASAQGFEKSFRVTDEMFEQLVEQAKAKNIEGNDEERKFARKQSDVLLKAYIGRNIYGDECFYRLYQPIDDILQRAIEELDKQN